MAIGYIDAMWLIGDAAAFAVNPTLAGAGMIGLDLLTVADPTGLASSAVHAGKAAKLVKAIHENSILSKKAQHSYEIFEMVNGRKNIVKVGISGGRLNKNRTSKRVNSQVNRWNKAAGYSKFQARVVKKNMTRAKALNWEKGRIRNFIEAGAQFPNTTMKDHSSILISKRVKFIQYINI